MILRSIFLLNCLLVFPAPAHSIHYYNAGDTLYCWAISGLSVREAPQLNAARITTVPYAAAVVALESKFYQDTDSSILVEAVLAFAVEGKKMPAVYLRGRFVRITYAGQTGFVFDAYLSAWPALRYDITEQNNFDQWKYFERFPAYAERVFGLISVSRDIQPTTGDEFEHTRYLCGNGITIDQWAGKAADTRLILPDLSPEEGFLLFNYLHDYEQQVRRFTQISWEPPWENVTRTEMPGGDIFLFFSNGQCEYSVKWLTEGVVVISWSCTC